MENFQFTAPVGGDSKRIDDVALIPSGMRLCTFYGLADLGTQDSKNFGPKHRCQLAFEFPQELRIFYEGDIHKPSVIWSEETFSMAPKANLRKHYVHGMLGRNLSDEEAAKFNIASLLGKPFVATISHTADGKYANITSITPLSDQNRLMFGLQDMNVPVINDIFAYHMSQGFISENFKKLPKFIREKIKNSEEGEAHKKSGGTFLEPDPSDFKNAGKKLKMLPNAEFTYEQYKAAEWTDQMLVDNGKAVWEAPVAPPAPVGAPAAPQAPIAPAAPVAPQAMPAAPSAIPPAMPAATPPAPALNPQDTNGRITLVPEWRGKQSVAEWLASGWTEEAMLAKGYAVPVK